MKPSILTFFLLVCTLHLFSQTKPDQTLSHSINYDTLLSPDYFNAKITVAEYVKNEGEGRKRKYFLVPLDTAMNNLMQELKQLGYNLNLRKSSMSEKFNKAYNEKSYFDGRILFQVTYEFDMSSKDSIERLFQKIKKETLQSFIVSPKFYSATIENAKEKLINRGLVATKEYARKLAEENDQRIIKQTNTFLGFNQKYNANPNNLNSYGQPKDFILDLNSVEYTLNIYYTYIFEDK